MVGWQIIFERGYLLARFLLKGPMTCHQVWYD